MDEARINDPLTEDDAEAWITAAELQQLNPYTYAAKLMAALPRTHSAANPCGPARLKFSRLFTEVYRRHKNYDRDAHRHTHRPFYRSP